MQARAHAKTGARAFALNDSAMARYVGSVWRAPCVKAATWP